MKNILKNRIGQWLFSLFIIASNPLFSCTSILVTKGASRDGSIFVTHSDDNYLSDSRIIYVPANDYPEGSKRPVFFSGASNGTPEAVRYAGIFRGPNYIDPSKPETIPIGWIDQVPHTYAYFDGSYAIMNEHQLMIGESSCGAKIEPNPKKGERIFYSADLSRVALERTTSARDAILLMGRLIDQYGYYGSGECLIVADKEEGWVFEMCGGTMDGKSGLWVAKKVPDGEIFATANEFRIREIDPNDPNMMYSKNLFDEVQKRGWWNPKAGPLDWLKAVSFGEMNHPYHALRRIWRVFSIFAPSARFSPWVKDGFTKDYPFSIKPDRKISLFDLMAIHRDHYEGTEFDLTQGIAAGPFGCPDRYSGPYDGDTENVLQDKKMWGAWERSISHYTCGCIWINQARSFFPDPIGGICWFGPSVPCNTCFVPFFVGVSDLPKNYQLGSSLEFDHTSAWWIFNFVSNWSLIKFSQMKTDIRTLQKSIETKEIQEVLEMSQHATSLLQQNPCTCQEYLTEFCSQNCKNVLTQWQKLSTQLIVKYDKGFVNQPKFAEETGYIENWLKKTDYQRGPISYKKS